MTGSATSPARRAPWPEWSAGCRCPSARRPRRVEPRRQPRLVRSETLIGRDPLAWLGDRAVVELFGDLAREGLVWDVVPITAEQVAAVTRLAEAVPDLRLVVDHLARRPVDSEGGQPWANQVRELARCPGVACKVSVGVDAVTAWPTWRPGVLRPNVAHVLENFGSGRLMLASNWPVVLLRATYAQAWAT